MNALLCKPCVMTDAELDIRNIPGSLDDFATVTMQAIKPEDIATDEEELHISFEEAISGRVEALGIGHAGLALSTTAPLHNRVLKQALSIVAHLEVERHRSQQKSLVSKRMLHVINYVCMALMFMLIGFDIMGLLILHSR